MQLPSQPPKPETQEDWPAPAVNELQQIGIQFGHRVGLFALSLVLLGFILELVRRDILREKYALFWLGTACAGFVIGIFPDLLVRFALLVRFQLLTALFVFSFLFVLGIVLALTVLISRLSERNRALAQHVALLAEQVERLRSDRDGS